uniref:Putative salivary protein n=1 Tax=Ixodes scapularis TaxID=6945 RepID=Q4PMM1_IXOSC|nr:putative salivary protein [Ixodes scapularis]
MKTCIRVALAVLCVITSCNAGEHCNCQREEILETISEVFEYRGAWPFLTSSEPLYLMRLPMNPLIYGIQCVISTLNEENPIFPNVRRLILYTDSFQGPTWQSKSVTLTMQNKTASKSSTSFTTTDLPRFGYEFPVVFADSKCLIFWILESTVGGRRGCAWWVKKSAKDNSLWHCRLIFDFFCGVSYQQIYNKQACDHLTKQEKNQ